MSNDVPTCTKQATLIKYNFVLASMSSMTSSSNVHLSLEATCIYRPYNPYIIMFTRTLVRTHQVIAMINSGIGTDSHFNLVHGAGYTPLGYCITLPALLFMNFDQRVDKACTGNMTTCYFIMCPNKMKKKNNFTVLYLFSLEIIYFYSVGPLGSLFRGVCH